MALIPPTPPGSNFSSYTWQDWYEKVRRAINNSATISWSQITDFTGGSILPIAKGGTGNATGLAASATKLATARNINGVAFDGTGNITVTADATTLTGASLPAGVTGSSLTSVGTLGSLTVTGIISGGRFIPTSSTVPTNGMYLPAANVVSFATNTTERLRIGSTGSFEINSFYGTDFRVSAGGQDNVGLEWNRVSSTAGIINSYNRASSLYCDLSYDALSHTWKISGTQKMVITSGGNIGFFNSAGVAQPTTAGASATRVAGATTALVTDTYDGYTVAQVVKALRNLGLLA